MVLQGDERNHYLSPTFVEGFNYLNKHALSAGHYRPVVRTVLVYRQFGEFRIRSPLLLLLDFLTL
jgi:hypothetical protein